VVPEDHPLVGGNEVAAVFETLGGSGAQRVKRQYFGGNETTVETIADRIGRNGSDDQPEGIDLLAAVQGDGGEREGSEQADGNPEDDANEFGHGRQESGGQHCGAKERGSQAGFLPVQRTLAAARRGASHCAKTQT